MAETTRPSNEYFQLRRAARHIVVGLWTSDDLWSKPERILEAHDAVKILREIADSLPPKTGRDRNFWREYFERI